MRALLVVMCLAVLPAVECDFPNPFLPDDGQVCTALYAYGISATVTDANTGDPINNAVLTLTEGDYSEVMDAFPPGGYVGAGERPGNYTLTINVPGVVTGTVNDIEVNSDPCHVIGVALDIRVSLGTIVVER
jgi:hypothetical protein